MSTRDVADRTPTEAVVLHYLAVLRRRRGLVLTFAAIVVIVVTVATLASEKYFSATAVIEISPRAPQVFEVDEVSEVGGARGNTEIKAYYATQYRILQSRRIMGESVRVLREEHGVADFDDKDKPGDFLRSHMKLEPVVDTNLVNIVVEYPDPAKAALFADTIALVYMEQNLARSLEASQEALEWLGEQHNKYREARLDSDSKVAAFRAENDLVGMTEEFSTTQETLSRLQSAWSEAHTEQIGVAAELAELRRLNSRNDWSALATHLAADRPVLSGLLQEYENLQQEKGSLATRYKAAHPEMVRVQREVDNIEARIRSQIQSVMGGRQAELTVLQNREAALEVELDKIKVEYEALEQTLIQLRFLESESDRNDQFFQSLDTRMVEVDLSNFIRANNVTLLDRAVASDNPVRPVLLVNLLMALFLGAFGGSGLAFVVEYLDTTVRTREDIEDVVGVPLLGVVPRISEADFAELGDPIRAKVYVEARPRSTTAECMRTIRTNVIFRTPKKKTPVLLVTSSTPLEGKSFTSANLAASIAMTGSRVLLIDADLRRPTVHKLFGMDLDVGLSNVLADGASLESVVQRSHVKGLDVVVAGPIPPNPAELLGGAVMRELLAQSHGYDTIMVDSPPVNVIADPLVLAPLADGVLVVVEAERTRRAQVSQAVARLTEMNGKVLGVIVNKLDEKSLGYGYYYYYGYGYYSNEDDGEPVRQQA